MDRASAAGAGPVPGNRPARSSCPRSRRPSTAASARPSVPRRVSSFPRALQRLATALVVLATALRLCLPWWHDATCRHHHPATMASAANASEAVAVACACPTDLEAKQPWWTTGGDRDEGNGDDGRGEPHHAAAFVDATCLACELAHVPPSPPPPRFELPTPDFDNALATARPTETPRASALTTTPPSRAPPHHGVVV